MIEENKDLHDQIEQAQTRELFIVLSGLLDELKDKCDAHMLSTKQAIGNKDGEIIKKEAAAEAAQKSLDHQKEALKSAKEDEQRCSKRAENARRLQNLIGVEIRELEYKIALLEISPGLISYLPIMSYVSSETLAENLVKTIL